MNNQTPNDSRRQRTFLMWLSAVLIVVLLLGGLIVIVKNKARAFHVGMLHPIVSEVDSPSGMGTALFYVVGIDDRWEHLYVRDPGVPGTTLIRVGIGHWPEFTSLDAAAWSNDGSVIAVKLGEQYTHAYDFRIHTAILPLANQRDQRKPTDEEQERNSRAIEVVLKSRGGVREPLITGWEVREKARAVGFDEMGKCAAASPASDGRLSVKQSDQ